MGNESKTMPDDNIIEKAAPWDIHDRTEEYALRAIKLFRYLKRKPREDGMIIGRQYLRSATSIGANMVEADSAESGRDFVHKCNIALKEAKESRYWLRLLVRGEIVTPKRLSDLAEETDEIIAVIASIIVKTKKTMTNSKCKMQNEEEKRR